MILFIARDAYISRDVAFALWGHHDVLQSRVVIRIYEESLSASKKLSRCVATDLNHHYRGSGHM